jgi:molybdate transport system regulatory protein
MKLSARNQLPGKVKSIKEGAVNAIVTLDVAGTHVTGTISMAAVQELGLTVGMNAVAVIKATEVMVGLGTMRLSARNQLPGKVKSIKEGAVNAIVSLDVCNGQTVTATISMAAVEELGLTVGMDAVAVIKATSVMFGVEA